jgi:beta-mannosidase
VDEKYSAAAARQGFGRRAIAKVLPQQLPSWNRTVLDGSLKVVVERNDGTRPVVAHSGVAPHLPQLDGTDSHLWFGWYESEVEELAEFAATVPRSVRFVSEFGAQAPPPTADFCEPGAWPDLPWDRLVHDFGCQTAVFDERCSPDEFGSFAEWREAAQRYQSELVGRTIEVLRRLKYHPTGGFCVYKLSDARPSISFSLIDHAGQPKAAFDALRRACRPVIAVADAPPLTVAAGSVLELTLHVVSDLRTDLAGAEVRATATWRSGTREWTWGGDIPADSCLRIAVMSLPVPPSPGPLQIAISVVHPSMVDATTVYTTTIAG